MWYKYKQAESLMDMRKITNPAFRLVLVQCTLPDALQETVAHILEADIPASAAYAQLKAELTRLHEKTSWDRPAELFALPLCDTQKGTKLLAAMEGLKPEDPELWFRWMYRAFQLPPTSKPGPSCGISKQSPSWTCGR